MKPALLPVAVLLFPLFAQAAGCPVEPEGLAKLAKKDLRELCRRSIEARQPAESMPDTYSTLRQCEASLSMAAEDSRIIAALAGRDASVGPKLGAALALKDKSEDSTAIANSLHSYQNVSLAAAYRAQLATRKTLADSESARKLVEHDRAHHEKDLESSRRFAGRLRAEGKGVMADVIDADEGGKEERFVNAAEAVASDLEFSQACVESVEPALNAAFDAAKNKKAQLLNDGTAKLIGDKEEARQQNVFDVLTDESKQDFFYKVDVGCPEIHCSMIFSGVGYLIQSSTLRTAGSIVVTGLAADQANRQGLSAGQEIREAANAGIGISLLKTEISRINAGEVLAYETPILCPSGDFAGQKPCHTAGEK